MLRSGRHWLRLGRRNGGRPESEDLPAAELARHAPRGRRAVHQIASDAAPARHPEPRVVVGWLVGVASLAAFAGSIWLGVANGNPALALFLATAALLALGVTWIELRLQTA